jgi:hypothetical protein
VAVIAVPRALLALLVAISDVGWHLLVIAQGCLLSCLCRAVHDCIVVGGDALRLPECAPKEVPPSASLRALLAVGG